MSTGWNNKPVAVDTAAIAVAVAAAVDVPTAADNATAVAGALTIPSAADNATAVAAELDTTLTTISGSVTSTESAVNLTATQVDGIATYIVGSVATQASVDALAPPVLSYATGNLGPADFTVIPAVGGQVITVYGFIFWSVDGAARKLAYTNADGSNENYYHASDFNITSNGIDPRSSVITMTPTGRPLYATPSGKAFSAIGDGDLQFMIWYTQA